MGKAIELV